MVTIDFCAECRWQELCMETRYCCLQRHGGDNELLEPDGELQDKFGTLNADEVDIERDLTEMEDFGALNPDTDEAEDSTGTHNE